VVVAANLDTILSFTNALLGADSVRDYCPNGLQVQGRESVSRILLGVTASQALIDAAIAKKADMILVHHGYFWKGENPAITGQKMRRIRALLQHDVSLVAYHLPLDIHPVIGNNASLGRHLGLSDMKFHQVDGLPLLAVAKLSEPVALHEWVETLARKLQRLPQLIKSPAGLDRISTIAWCTGAAQSFLQNAESLGADLYISGEISEPNYHSVMEGKTHYLAAGHHATERYGIQALGDKISAQFDVAVEFVDIPNPV
jgi:dinuclear metal center YbgI/SA1388 family protein